MPSVMSDRRPAALMRGPRAKPKSKVVAPFALRAAAVNSAAMPAGKAPARSKAQLKRAAISHMRRLSKLPDRVRSFFGHKTFRYAA